jgi:hypothetical protein
MMHVQAKEISVNLSKEEQLLAAASRAGTHPKARGGSGRGGTFSPR